MTALKVDTIPTRDMGFMTSLKSVIIPIISNRDYVSGDYVRGDYVRGDYVRGDYVRAPIVSEV